jgi:hypothetical protein
LKDGDPYFPFALSSSRYLDARDLGVGLAVKNGLYAALDVYGSWPFMAICGGLTALIIAAAFAWDWHKARSRR